MSIRRCMPGPPGACTRSNTKRRGKPDRAFLERVFHKLLLNFTWWVNRKDTEGRNVFEGGFLGLDNIGVFDRSAPLPDGGFIEQADGTGWMAMYCLNLLTIALELAREDPAYEDVASKFWEHFLHIANAINHLGEDGTGMWDEPDGFFYDVLHMPDGKPRADEGAVGGGADPAVCGGDHGAAADRPVSGLQTPRGMVHRQPPRSHLQRSLHGGARPWRAAPALPRLAGAVTPHPGAHAGRRRVPVALRHSQRFAIPQGPSLRAATDGQEHRVDYEPGESQTGLFGGNSNWRGPVWFPLNYLLIESLQKFHHYLGDEYRVECPTGSGHLMTLWEVAAEISRRLSRLFLKDDNGRRPVNGANECFQTDRYWRDLVLFYEYFHADTGAGLGASHQTGWTGLVAKLLQQSGE